MKRIIIRTLGGTGIGYGHAYRCLSLAQAIQRIDRKVPVFFVINQGMAQLVSEHGFQYAISETLSVERERIGSLAPSLVIFDSYLGSNDYLREIKQVCPLMLIDDNNELYDASIPQILHNGNLYAEELGYSSLPEQVQLIGGRYLLMREAYWETATPIVKKEGVLLTTGGTDSQGILYNMLVQLKNVDVPIKAVIGPGYSEGYIRQIDSIGIPGLMLLKRPQSLKEAIATSKKVVTAGGSTAYEVLSQGTIPIIYQLADNQRYLCQALEKKGVAFLGAHPHIQYAALPELIRRESGNWLPPYNLLKNINSKGALLTAEHVLNYIKTQPISHTHCD